MVQAGQDLADPLNLIAWQAFQFAGPTSSRMRRETVTHFNERERRMSANDISKSRHVPKTFIIAKIPLPQPAAWLAQNPGCLPEIRAEVSKLVNHLAGRERVNDRVERL